MHWAQRLHFPAEELSAEKSENLAKAPAPVIAALEGATDA